MVMFAGWRGRTRPQAEFGQGGGMRNCRGVHLSKPIKLVWTSSFKGNKIDFNNLFVKNLSL